MTLGLVVVAVAAPAAQGASLPDPNYPAIRSVPVDPNYPALTMPQATEPAAGFAPVVFSVPDPGYPAIRSVPVDPNYPALRIQQTPKTLAAPTEVVQAPAAVPVVGADGFDFVAAVVGGAVVLVAALLLAAALLIGKRRGRLARA
jgi:hypothetical protein